MNTQLFFLGCLVRLFQLEMKRYQIDSEHAENKGQFKPLEGDEAADYDALKMWWYEIGMDNQIRLDTWGKNCAQGLRGATAKPASVIITPGS